MSSVEHFGMKRVAVSGVSGRMGRALLEAIAINEYNLRLGAAVHKKGSIWIGSDAGTVVGLDETGVNVSENLQPANFDVLIDFTLPEPALLNLTDCVKYGKPAVIGTTGFDSEQLSGIAEAAKKVPLVFAPNMSVGVNLCLHLLHKAAQVLKGSADVEIIETHHRNKLDAPSGTALAMGQVVADAFGQDLESSAVHGRRGRGDVRKQSTIGFSSIRAGDVVGDHTVLFATEGERIELSHKASDRSIYAKGALRAAAWVVGKEPGLYSMHDVLGLT